MGAGEEKEEEVDMEEEMVVVVVVEEEEEVVEVEEGVTMTELVRCSVDKTYHECTYLVISRVNSLAYVFTQFSEGYQAFQRPVIV